MDIYLFPSLLFIPALTAITTVSPCTGCSGAWAPLSAPCPAPAPAAAGWPGSESGLDTSATPPHYSLHWPRTLHQPFLILTLILMNSTVKCTFKDRALVCKACWKPKVKAQKAKYSVFILVSMSKLRNSSHEPSRSYSCRAPRRRTGAKTQIFL